MDIAQIAQKLKEGDEEAFRAFYEVYFGRIFHFLLTILGNPDDAEDVTSVAFMYVWDNRGKLRKNELLVSWLYQVAKHRAFDHRRKVASRATSSLAEAEDTVLDQSISPEQFVDQYFTKEATKSILQSLSEVEKSIIHLRFVENLDFKEISQKLGMTSVAVRVRLHRSIKKLQSEIGEEASGKSFWQETIL